jgi:DMSO reductase family type II enzyme chaperone
VPDSPAPPVAAPDVDPSALADTRTAVYRFLLAALDKPTVAQHAWFSGPEFHRTLERLSEEFGLPPPEGEPAEADAAGHEARYLACFEVGVPEPPVPLLASHYNRREPVPQVIHEHILFYRRFGVRPAAANIEPADHLLSELAFLIRLDDLLRAGVPEAGSVLRARRDFLRRHAAAWPARAAVETEAKHLPGVYRALLALLAAAVGQDLELTEAAVAGISEGQS